MTPCTWRRYIRGWNDQVKRMNQQTGGKDVMPLSEARKLQEHFRKVDAEKANE